MHARPYFQSCFQYSFFSRERPVSLNSLSNLVSPNICYFSLLRFQKLFIIFRNARFPKNGELCVRVLGNYQKRKTKQRQRERLLPAPGINYKPINKHFVLFLLSLIYSLHFEQQGRTPVEGSESIF